MFLKSLCPSCRHVVDNLISAKILEYNSERIDKLIEEIVSGSGSHESVDLKSDQREAIISSLRSNDGMETESDCESKSNETIDLEDKSKVSFSGKVDLHSNERQGSKGEEINLNEPILFSSSNIPTLSPSSETGDELEHKPKSSRQVTSINNEKMDTSRKRLTLEEVNSPKEKEIKKIKISSNSIDQLTVPDIKQMNDTFFKLTPDGISADSPQSEMKDKESITKQYEPLDEIDEMNTILDVYYRNNKFKQTESKKLSDPSKSQSFTSPTVQQDVLEFVYESELDSSLKENHQFPADLTTETNPTRKINRGNRIYRCLYCEQQCKPGGRGIIMRHLNGYTRRGIFHPPCCLKRKELQPADPITGIYERLEPILIQPETNLTTE